MCNSVELIGNRKIKGDALASPHDEYIYIYVNIIFLNKLSNLSWTTK